jgi:FkbM family methyltransferase
MSERKLTEWALPYIKSFRTYIDIGASTGKTAIPFIGKFEKIYCFEPNPRSFEELSKNKNLICYNCAIGDKNEIKELVMNDSTNNPEHGSISEERNKDWLTGERFSVEVKRLDDFKFESIDFIKIDTEQYELQVIEGAIKTIKKHKPTIFFENKRNEADAVILLLLDLGFTVKKWKSDTIAYYTD